MSLEPDFAQVRDFNPEICLNIHLDKNSQIFGKLIHRKDTLGLQNIWHYSVIVSGESAISWGPVDKSPLSLGEITLHSIDWQVFELTNYYKISDKNAIAQRINAAIKIFHKKWFYGLWGFNCEHFARLISSGCPDSYQVKENLLINAIPGAVFTNHEAYRQLYSIITESS